MKVCKFDGQFWIYSASGSPVAGPYMNLSTARLAYPKATQGTGVNDREWKNS